MDVQILCAGYHEHINGGATACGKEVALFTCDNLKIISGNFLQQKIFDDEATLRIDGLFCESCDTKLFDKALWERENEEPSDDDLPDADDYDTTPTEIEALTDEIQGLSEKVEDAKVNEDKLARAVINKIKGGLSNNLRGEVCAELRQEYKEKIKKDVMQEMAVEIEREVRQEAIEYYKQELARFLGTLANGVEDKIEDIASPLIKKRTNNGNMKRVLDL